MADKYTAVWVSHSSMSDYLKCPRAYYIRNVYRDPKTNRKVSLMNPSLGLGQTVHDVIDMLAQTPTSERPALSILDLFEKKWQNISGKLGGFRDQIEEMRFKNRGIQMISRIQKHPGPLFNKTIKLRQELPHFWLSEEDNIILCGKIDWLEYFEDTDSIGVIDFKTGKHDEDPGSLQLPIYYLLASECQKRSVNQVKYWYLDRDDEPIAQSIPDSEKQRAAILEIAKKIALARKLERFVCSKKDGCAACRPLEKILVGAAIRVGTNDFGQDIYVLPTESESSIPF